jgi:hypothetical protein
MNPDGYEYTFSTVSPLSLNLFKQEELKMVFERIAFGGRIDGQSQVQNVLGPI